MSDMERTMSNDNGTVTTKIEGHIMTVTVDRADKMNGFTPEMFNALSDGYQIYSW